MHKLLLLRHAKSSWDDATLSDHARPLNRRGQLTAAAVRATLHGMALHPDLVLVSSSRRTLQTLDALAPWDDSAPAGPPVIRPMDALYLASAPDILELAAGTAEEVGCLMIVGHNPGLHDAALRLAGETRDDDREFGQLRAGFPTGALAVFNCRSWASLGAADTGADVVLQRVLVPRDLTAPAA